MAKISRTFGWRPGAKIRVEFDGDWLSVRGTLGAQQARVPIADVETAAVNATALGHGPANMRQTFVELVGKGVVLGRAAVNTMVGRAGAADEAAAWIREELARRRAT